MAGGAPTYAIIGALAAFPRRLAAREVVRQSGVLRGGSARGATHVVFARTLLERMVPDEIVRRFDAVLQAGGTAVGENGFRRRLGLMAVPREGGVSRAALIEQSRLDGRTADLLALFDAFEADSEPFTFRDVILARKYAKLISAGSGWADIARSVHRAGPVASLTALALQGEGTGVFVLDGERLTEIDGQGLLPFGERDDADQADELFEVAEHYEQAGEHAAAAAAYGAYLALVPSDPVAAFNRANALRAAGDTESGLLAYALAIKLDPGFAEAWFNCGTLLKDMGRADPARQHFARAIALDGRFADPVYSLAALEYDAGNLAEARRWWSRYLELDSTSEWAVRARRGIQLIDMTTHAERSRTGGGAA